VEVMVSEQEKHGSFQSMVQEPDLQDLIHSGLDEYDEKCRRKKHDVGHSRLEIHY